MDQAGHLDNLVREHFPDEQAPGGAVMLWQHGQEPIFACRGMANLETSEAVTPDTTFRLASVSKQFTAACVLQLVESGRIALEQPLTDLLPGFPAYGDSITVEHLLRHTSGLKDYEKLIPPDQATPVTDCGVVDMLAAQAEGDFAPGEKFRYSNSGYAVLAVLVGGVSGLDFPAYLCEQVFARAGMKNTLAFVDGPGQPQPKNRAIGYAQGEDGQYRWADQNVTTAVLGDGGIYCSVRDYAIWIEAYLSGKVIGREWVDRAFTPGATTGGEVVPYGYGWRLESLVGDNKGVWRPYHPGSTSGFRNGVVIDHERRRAALALSNRCNGDAVAIARQLVGDLA